MSWNDNLNGIHREIASEGRTPLRVLAGPGTGKTFAMMRRIAKLLEDGVDPNRILAVTFTRTAARDLREQLENLGIDGSDGVKATTLHALCFSALSKEEVFEATGRSARPLLSHEIRQMVNDLAPNFGGKRKIKLLLEAYEAAWARMQNDEAGLPNNEEDANFQASLVNWLRYHRAMLIGELVPLSLNFIRNNPSISIFPEFDHVLVDEYQDLNKSDQELVQELAINGSLTIIGDDNQSIYSFRHANPEGIRNFDTTSPDVVTYIIEECRRCPPNIVDISNALIANDQHRARATPLVPVLGRQAAGLYIVQHRSVDDEVEAVSDYIEDYLEKNNTLPSGQVLVLATRRFIGNKIRRALIQRGFNSLSYFYEDELDNVGAAEGFCLLKLLVEPSDRAALRAWLGLRTGDGYARSYARLRTYARQYENELRSVLDLLSRGEISLPYTSNIVGRYQLLQQKLNEIERLDGLDLVRTLWSVDDEDVADIRLLAERIAMDTPEPSGLLEEIVSAITQPELPGSDDDIIRVMSLHKSKGLTAALVVVVGCVAGALPSINTRQGAASEDAQYEEQRRLFYVAITRATDTLVINSSTSMLLRDAMAGGITIVRDLHNGFVRTSSSPYIAELGRTAPRAINTDQWRAMVGF